MKESVNSVSEKNHKNVFKSIEHFRWRNENVNLFTLKILFSMNFLFEIKIQEISLKWVEEFNYIKK